MCPGRIHYLLPGNAILALPLHLRTPASHSRGAGNPCIPQRGVGRGTGHLESSCPSPGVPPTATAALPPTRGRPFPSPLASPFLSDPEVSQSPPTPGSSWATLGEQGLPESRGSRSHVFPLPLGDNSPWVSVLAL